MSQNSTNNGKLTPCGCCPGPAEPQQHANRSGKTAIDYRIGDHAGFLKQMLEQIHAHSLPDGDHEGHRPLSSLTTRSTLDPAIALMDAWAMVGDVLTFYQERISNEAFLGTATQRRSILELARAIGYELRPGVSASAYLAFTVEDAEGSPKKADVPGGTQVMSIPAGQDELPQTFETTEEITAFADRNALAPLLYEPQALSADTDHLFLKGTGLNLKAGDRILMALAAGFTTKIIFNAEPYTDLDMTRIDFDADWGPPQTITYSEDPAVLDTSQPQLELTRQLVNTQVYRKTWQEEDLQAFIAYHEWDSETLLAYVETLREESFQKNDDKIHVFRERLSFFGHNAPQYLSLPEEMRTAGTNGPETGKAFPYNWDDTGWEIWKDSLKQNSYYADNHAYLERPVEDLPAPSWMAIERKGATTIYEIEAVDERSVSGFAMSAKVTGVQLKDAGGSGVSRSSQYKVRNAIAHVKSEELPAAPVPVLLDTDRTTIDKGTKEITLSTMVLGLIPDQPVLLSGQDPETEDAVVQEILALHEISHHRGYTRISLKDGLTHNYLRDTVAINANIVLANHGESAGPEALGSGDGATANQQFELKKPPLSHTSASTASGVQSTLSVWVNDVEWEQVDSLYGQEPTAQVYTVRLDNDANAAVIFGDGQSGARLPTGQENIVATYRSGTGMEGEVGADSLSLLKKRPFGIRSVTNPLEAGGADDPEKLEDARTNAPLTVMTLDRIVSLQDYEDFTRAYTGIGKARAVDIWDGESRRVHITVADASGDAVVSPLYENLLEAIEAARDPLCEVELATAYRLYLFYLTAKVRIEDAYDWDVVKPLIETRLKETFGFDQRGFGQSVSAAEIVQVMHREDGVVAVDIDALYKVRPDESPSEGSPLNAVLVAGDAEFDADQNTVIPAELLLIHEYGIQLSEMT